MSAALAAAAVLPPFAGAAESTAGGAPAAAAVAPAPQGSLVLFQSDLSRLDAKAVAEAIEGALGLTAAAEEGPVGPSAYRVSGQAPLFVLNLGGHPFLLNQVERPYFDDPDAATAPVRDVRLRRVITGMKGWVSVDAVTEGETGRGASDDGVDGDGGGEVGKPGSSATLRQAGKVVAALIDGGTSGVYHPASGGFNFPAAEVVRRLAGDDPLAAFTVEIHAPVVRTPAAALAAAVKQARAGWGDFVGAFNRRDGTQVFLVKSALPGSAPPEHVWSRVESIDGGRVAAVLLNQPLERPGGGGPAPGGPVIIDPARLSDWLYTTPDGQVVGGFTRSPLTP